MLLESPAIYVVLRIPAGMTEADIREAAVRHWAEGHRSRGYTMPARRIKKMPDPQSAKLARTYLRHHHSNYGELVRGRTCHEANVIRAQVDQVICRCFPGLSPS